MSHQRQWLEREGSEDSRARALWAAGTALGRSKTRVTVTSAHSCFDADFLPVEGFSSPRAWAFALLAIQEYLQTLSGDRNVNQLREAIA